MFRFAVHTVCPIAAMQFRVHALLLAVATSALPKVPATSAAMLLQTEELDAPELSSHNETEKVRYGPNGCVSTWLSRESRCMIQTHCIEKEIAGYDFSMLCVQASGNKVRHVFGADSFDPQEVFDTLVICQACTADATELYAKAKQADDKQIDVSLKEIVDDVEQLKGEMVVAAKAVQKLNVAVFEKKRQQKATAQLTTPTTTSALTTLPTQATTTISVATNALPVQAFVRTMIDQHRLRGNKFAVRAPVAKDKAALMKPVSSQQDNGNVEDQDDEEQDEYANTEAQQAGSIDEHDDSDSTAEGATEADDYDGESSDVSDSDKGASDESSEEQGDASEQLAVEQTESAPEDDQTQD